jgi:hypothetical protein
MAIFFLFFVPISFAIVYYAVLIFGTGAFNQVIANDGTLMDEVIAHETFLVAKTETEAIISESIHRSIRLSNYINIVVLIVIVTL